MKPTKKTCAGCPHLTHNMYFTTGHIRLFCNLAAQYLNKMKNCPRQLIELTNRTDTIRKAMETEK